MKQVDILMATYKPNWDYFNKLLSSINNQTYNNIKFIIRDDSEDIYIYQEIEKKLNIYLTNINYELSKNKKNLGSNKTFEYLTYISKGDYIAYCDQDDIWEDEKITKLVKAIEIDNSLLCYSDLSVIDSKGNTISNSFKSFSTRLKHINGEKCFPYFIRSNSVTGCAMLINSSIAKKALPFSNYYVHDHWLALFASSKGSISYINETLVKYRIHENNQIGGKLLDNINDKDDYLNKKLLQELKRYTFLLNSDLFSREKLKSVQSVEQWTINRINFFKNRTIKNFIIVMKSIERDKQLIFFEIIINLVPNILGKKILKILKN